MELEIASYLAMTAHVKNAIVLNPHSSMSAATSVSSAFHYLEIASFLAMTACEESNCKKSAFIRVCVASVSSAFNLSGKYNIASLLVMT